MCQGAIPQWELNGTQSFCSVTATFTAVRPRLVFSFPALVLSTIATVRLGWHLGQA